MIDVVGVINEDSTYTTINKKDGSGKMEKRSMFIFDQSGVQVELTFWGNESNRTDLIKDNIIVLKNG